MCDSQETQKKSETQIDNFNELDIVETNEKKTQKEGLIESNCERVDNRSEYGEDVNFRAGTDSIARRIEESLLLQAVSDTTTSSNACVQQKRHNQLYGVRVSSTDQIKIDGEATVRVRPASADDVAEFNRWFVGEVRDSRPTSIEFANKRILKRYPRIVGELKSAIDDRLFAFTPEKLRLCDWVLSDLYEAEGDRLNYRVLESIYSQVMLASPCLLSKPIQLQKQYIFNRLSGVEIITEENRNSGNYFIY